MHVIPTILPPLRRVRRTAATLCATGALCLMGAASAQAETIVAVGTGQAEVTPGDTTSNSSIKAAVRAAEREAIPRALINARLQAALIGDAAGLALGAIASVEQQFPTPFGPYFFGRFGPNTYCGTITRGIFRRSPEGKRTLVRRVTRRQCSAPEYATTTLTVTFGAAPRLPA